MATNITATPALKSETANLRAGKASVTRIYQVRKNTALEAQNACVALAAPTGMAATDANATYIEFSKTAWNVTVEYSYPEYNGGPGGGGGDPAQAAEDPLERPAIVEDGAEVSEEEYTEDALGNPILNGAWMMYASNPVRKRSRRMVTVTKNISTATYAALDLLSLADTTNTNAVTIKGKNYGSDTLLMAAPIAREMYERAADGTEYHYWQIVYTLTHDPNGWIQSVLEAGFYELVDGTWRPILDEHGQQVTEPWLLNADGTKNTTGDPVYTDYQPYVSSTWTGVSFV